MKSSGMIHFRRLLIPAIGFCLLGAASGGEGMAADRCLSPSQTREMVAARKLAEPVAVLRRASAAARAEPLGARLCARGDGWIYDITLLRPDGKVLKLAVDATSGKVLESRR